MNDAERPSSGSPRRASLRAKTAREHLSTVGGVGLKLAAGATAFLIVGNLVILAASVWARQTTSLAKLGSVPGVNHLEAVDGRLWRGAAPTAEGYQALAAAGTDTIVDLRAEDGLEHDAALVESLGMKWVHIPVRDGQAPTPSQVEAFLRATDLAVGRVFVHCGAGVGRTGAMVGAYRVTRGESNGRWALRQNLAVGPPTLEQVAFVIGLTGGDLDKPHVFLRATSRVLDAPRRLWSRFGL